jgi:ankyrin repeat protein
VSKLTVVVIGNYLRAIDPNRKDLDYSDAQLLHRLSSPAHSIPRYRIGKNLPGTSEWLLSHSVFSRWISSREKNIVWIVGKPGSGKSTLARFVVDTLQNPSICAYKHLSGSSEVQSDALEVQTPRVLYFFCSYVDPPSNAVAVLRSLLHQLLAVQPSLLRYISPDDRLRCGQQTAQASLLGGLLAQVAEYVDIIVVIDALDELDEPVRDDLLGALAPAPKLSRWLNISPLDRNEVSESQVHSHPPHSSFKIFCTSRLESYLELPVGPSAYTINLSQDEAAMGIDYDIRLFIKSMLDRYTRQSLLWDSQKKAIEKRLVEKAEGIFLWVALQTKSLFALQTESRDISSVLAHLPRGLENSYSQVLEALQRQPPGFADVGLKTLKWLLHAQRPLYVSELSEALAFKTDSRLPRSLTQRHPDMSTLVELCGNLIVVDEFDSTVQLIHKTVRDFLLDSLHPKVSSLNDEARWAEGSLAQACLSYLALQDFGDLEVCCVKGNNLRKQNLNEWLPAPAELFWEFPFLEYAAKYWFTHLGSISVKHDDFSASELGGLVHLLSNPKSAPFRIWFPIYWFSHCTETWERRRYPEYPTELIVLAFLGNETEIRHLLRWKKVATDECTPAGEEWTPLMAAAWMGNESVVDLLLECHAGDNAEPQQNARTLVQAIERGHITIAQKLIGHFTKIQSSLPFQRSILDISGEEGVTPLIASVRGGSRELVAKCLSLGADVNARGFHPYPRFLAWVTLPPEIELALPVTPLGAAISIGSIEMSSDLLHSGADIISSKAIFVAARTSNDGLLKLLLDNGADVDTKYDQNVDGWTPLHCAAFYGNRNMVERLLSHGAEVDSMDKFGWTPFQLACDSGKLEVAKTLLEKSTQSSISKNQALLYACSLADYELVKLLLGAGSSPQATGRHNGKMALDYLLDADDVVHPAPHNCVASRLPHQGGRVAVLELLLRQGAYLGHRDASGNTYLQLAARRRWPKVVNALLRSSKIDIDHRNDRGETAIDTVARFGDQDLCQALIHHGATVWCATFQNVIDSGCQAGVQCLVKEIKGPKRPRPRPSMEPYSLDTRQPLTSHSLLKYQNLVDPTDFSGGRFKEAAKFLALRNIDNLEKVKLTTENNFSFGNTVKSWIEDHSGTPWIWWPLTLRLHPLKPGEVWLEWLCVSCP